MGKARRRTTYPGPDLLWKWQLRWAHVRNFSWLTPEASRGNFGSEIRIGYLHEKGVRTPVKGGTVSGNVFKALGTARYAKETVFRGDYVGPTAVRFEGLTITGS